MINLDSLSDYKAQRSYAGHIIYLEYAKQKGTWSVWTATQFEPNKETDPRMVYGSADNGLLVRTQMLGSGAYKVKQKGTDAAKAFIDQLTQNLASR